jgi:hypothetical protein
LPEIWMEQNLFQELCSDFASMNLLLVFDRSCVKDCMLMQCSLWNTVLETDFTPLPPKTCWWYSSVTTVYFASIFWQDFFLNLFLSLKFFSFNFS